MTPRPSSQAKSASIRIDNLKGFQKLDKTQRIVTCDFLESSRELATMLNDSFGGRIAPISNELMSNCDKIEKNYRKNPNQFKYLDDMIVETATMNKCIAPIALIWLNMGLDLIVQFFTNLLNDKTVDEDLGPHITDAYERTLKPHHNYFLREMVTMFYTLLPTRSKLLGENMEYVENLFKIDRYLTNISENVRVVYDICNRNNVVAC